MSTTSSPGERSLATELSITNWIYPKKGGHDKLVDRLIVSGCLMCRAPVGRLSLLPSAMDGAAKQAFIDSIDQSTLLAEEEETPAKAEPTPSIWQMSLLGVPTKALIADRKLCTSTSSRPDDLAESAD